MSIERDLTVINKAGMHLRAASKIVSALKDFDCTVELSFQNRTANAKSIMSIAQLMAPKGSTLHMNASGPDAAQATQVLDRLFAEKFGEE